jgi:hypothetical protein
MLAPMFGSGLLLESLSHFVYLQQSFQLQGALCGFAVATSL